MTSSKHPLLAFSLRALRQISDRAAAARRRAHQKLELDGMTERELRDLGIGRGEVPLWLGRGPDAQSPRNR